MYKAKPIPVCHSTEFIDYILCAASHYSNLFCLLRKASPHTLPPLLALLSTKDKHNHLIQGQLKKKKKRMNGKKQVQVYVVLRTHPSILSYAFCSKCSLLI